MGILHFLWIIEPPPTGNQSQTSFAKIELDWPSIKDQLLVRDTTQVYKIVSLAPLYLSIKLSKRSDAHHYNTRKRDNLNLPLCRTVTAQRSFYYCAVIAWNSLTADTRNSPSLCTVKLRYIHIQYNTIPLFAFYLIIYMKEKKKIYIYIFFYLYLIRPGAEIIVRFPSPGGGGGGWGGEAT